MSSVSHLVQCHVYRSSNPQGELPKPTDPSVVRLVRIARPLSDTPETILKCLGESATLSSSSSSSSSPTTSAAATNANEKNSSFLQPIVEYLDQANLQYITFMSSSASSSSSPANHLVSAASSSDQNLLKSKLRGINDLLKKYDAEKTQREEGGDGGAFSSSASASYHHKSKSVDEQIRQVLASQGKKNVVHVAVYPAFSDGTCDLSSVSDEQYEGPLKLKEPLLEQLERRSGLPLLPNSSLVLCNKKANASSSLSTSSASVLPIAIVLVVESTASKLSNERSGSNNNNNNNADNRNKNLNKDGSKSNFVRAASAVIIREEDNEVFGPDDRRIPLAGAGREGVEKKQNFDPLQFAVVDVNSEVDGKGHGESSNMNNNTSRKLDMIEVNSMNASSTNALPLTDRPSLDRHPRHLHHEEEKNDDEDDDDYFERNRQQGHCFDETLKPFKSFSSCSSGAGDDADGGASNFVRHTNAIAITSPMSIAKRRRLEQLRQENLAKIERQRAEDERARREHAARYERDRQERRRLERDIEHQAELAQTRQQVREAELERKKRLYETREEDLAGERKEFSRRVQEFSTITQIEMLTSDSSKNKLSSNTRNYHRDVLAGSKTGANTSSGTFFPAAGLNASQKLQQQQVSGSFQQPFCGAFSSTQIGDTADDDDDGDDDKSKRKKVSRQVEKDLDGFVKNSVLRSAIGDQNMAELEAERERQRREIQNQQGLNVLLRDLGKQKAHNSKNTRKQLFDYKEVLSILKR